MEAEEQLKRQMDDITAEGTQQAYSDAIRAFGADRDARADAEKLGLGACRNGICTRTTAYGFRS